MSLLFTRAWLSILLAFLVSAARADVVVVFSEIMYHPAAASPEEELGKEWLELHNQMSVDIDLSGWALTEGVDFTFPNGTIIPAGGFLVVAANSEALGFPGALGPWSGRLDNGGERLTLRNHDDRIMDRLSYGTSGQWPSGPDGGGSSLSRRNMGFGTDDPRSWRESTRLGGTIGAENFSEFQPPTVTPLLEANAPWIYLADGADLGTAWREPGASEAGWLNGNGTFTLGTVTLPAPAVAGTMLPSGPVTYYFRKTFNFSGQTAFTQLTLRLLVDDGAAVYLNGTEIARSNLPPAAAAATAASNPRRGDPQWREFSVPASLLAPGANVLAVEVHQAGVLPSYSAAVVASEPVAYWRLDESAGAVSDLADVSGAPEQGPQDGTFSGFAAGDLAMPGPRPTDIVGGQPLNGFEPANAAPRFRGNAGGGDDVARFPDSGPLNFSLTASKLTAEAWVKGSPSQEDGAAIFAKGNGGGGEQFALDVVSGRYRFFARDPATNFSLYQHPSIGPNGTWQHVAIVHDPAANQMRLYINGVDAGGTTPRASLINNSVDVSVGARRLSGGAFDLNFDGSIDEVALYPRALSAAEIAQHYAAAFAASPGGIDTADAVFAAELIATETLPTGSAPAFVLNEISTDGVELINLAAGPGSTAGFTLVRVTPAGTTSIPVPDQTPAVGGFVQVPLTLNAGDRILLVAADGATVLDSFEVKATPRSRFPDGTGAWVRPVALTPGAANQVALNDAIVINEIMFDPPNGAFFPAGTARAGKWIELHNRSAAAVDLAGWKFSNGVNFTFPAGAAIPAGGFVVVADNPGAVIAVHGLDAARVFGPWSGGLSGKGERLELEDAAGNPADEVRYAGGGRWGDAPDGGGSSLELRDATADNAAPEAWAASDETGKAAWQTFTWSGPNNASQTGEPTLWHELNLLLMDGPGECLIDDVRVTDTVTGANLIQNGDFSAGAAHWRLLGNHRQSRVEAEPGQAGNQVLHLIASGAGEYQGNQIETTFAGNQTPINGRIYEISLRARWLSGGGRLNTRIYFNRLPRTNVLEVAANGGTPGAANSRAVPNLGPTFARLTHFPAVPDAAQPVTISVIAGDPQGIASMAVKYSVAGGAFQTAPMNAGDDGRFSAELPGQAAGRIVQFYIEGSDTVGAVSTFPARGPDSRALYVVKDGQATGAPTDFRLVMTTADATFLHTPVNTLSNELLGATLIVGEREVYHDIGVRLKGSFVGRNVGRVGFSLRFGPDQLFRGLLDKVAVDRSQHTAISVGEIIAKHIAVVAGGIAGMYDDLAHFIHPLGTYTSVASLRLASFDDEYLDTQFSNGSDGRMFEFEVLRWALLTVDGNPESPKLPGNEGGGTGFINLELRDWGNDKEAYRWNALQLMNRDEDDFTGLIALEKLFSQSGAAFAANAAQRLDVENWLRTLAYQSLVGPGDAVYTGSNIHNFRFYFRPGDGRALYFPWDWDSAFQRGTSASLVGGGNIAKVVTSNADLSRRYNAHLFDIIQKAFNTAYMSRWTQHYGAVAGQDFSSILGYIGARAAFVQSQLPTGTAFTATAGTVAANGTVAITGTANIAVAFIEVNGVLYVPVWSSTTAWSIVVPLDPGSNTLVIRGIGFDGALVAGATATTTVENPNGGGAPPLKINEWLAENDGAFRDPADGDSEDWFEIYNPTVSAVDLAGWTLTDMPGSTSPFVIPNGWSIPAGGFLLIWADDEPVQNPASPAAGDALHVLFKLSGNGDTIRLASPEGRLVDLVIFGSQKSNRSEGRHPDGGDVVSRLTLPTPAAPNALTAVAAPVFTAGGIEVNFSTTPGLRYTLQRTDELGVLPWENVEPAQAATGAALTITDATPVADRRFYRVLVAP